MAFPELPLSEFAHTPEPGRLESGQNHIEGETFQSADPISVEEYYKGYLRKTQPELGEDEIEQIAPVHLLNEQLRKTFEEMMKFDEYLRTKNPTWTTWFDNLELP